MPIPPLQIQHLEKAFAEILNSGIPTQKGAVNTVVKYKNLFFPIKFPITLANKYLNGNEIPTLDERGNPSFTTHEAIAFFQQKKFDETFKVFKLTNI